MLKGFLRVKAPGSSALLVLSASSCTDTASTISSLVTSSTPSPADGLLFCRSWTVPFCLNLFKSLFKDLLRLGGGTLNWPQVWAGYLIMKNQSKEKWMMAITSKHIQRGSGPSQPPGSSFPAKTLSEHWSTHAQARLKVFQLVKLKVMSGKRFFLLLLEP